MKILSEMDEVFKKFKNSDEAPKEPAKKEEKKDQKPAIPDKVKTDKKKKKDNKESANFPVTEESKPVIEQVQTMSEEEKAGKLPLQQKEKPLPPDPITAEDAVTSIAAGHTDQMNFEEMTDDEYNTVIVIIGDKGSSKTTGALSFKKSELPAYDERRNKPTVIACLSLDKQSFKPVDQYRHMLREKYPESDGYTHTPQGVKEIKEIYVYNAIKHWNRDTTQLKLISSEATYNFIKTLLDTVIAPLKPDYIIIDSVFKLNIIGEGVMRKRNGLSAYQGVANRNLWKERNDVVDSIYDRCVDYSGIASIFTTDFDLQEVKDEDTGSVRERLPKWVERIKKEATTVIEVEGRLDSESMNWFGLVTSSKDTVWKYKKETIWTDYAGQGGVNNLLLAEEVFERPKIE